MTTRGQRDRPSAGPLRPLALGALAVAIVAAVGWTVSTDTQSSSLAAPTVSSARIAPPPPVPAGDPIREVSPPAAIDIRNEVDGVEEITIVGVSALPITVARSDAPRIRAAFPGEITIDVQDKRTGQMLVRQAALRLLPDEMTTLVVRRDASGAVVLLAAP